jgi:hypothetical protein
LIIISEYTIKNEKVKPVKETYSRRHGRSTRRLLSLFKRGDIAVFLYPFSNLVARLVGVSSSQYRYVARIVELGIFHDALLPVWSG